MRRLLAAGLLIGLVAGCSSTGRSSTTSSGSALSKEAASSARGAVRVPAAGPAAGKAAGESAAKVAGASAALGRDVVRTGTLALQTNDVPGTIARAGAAVQAARGYVEGSQAAINPNDHRHDTATLTLKVPGSAYDGVLAGLRRLGTVLSSEDQREDVTGAVIDTSSRLATEQASVARVRTLLARARTIGEVVAVESELTKREASLESLKGRLAALKGQVSYATITMTLTSPSAIATRPKPTPAGFLGGLQAGWHSFATVVLGLLTALGAVLPFAVTLALLAALAVAVRRRVVRRAPAAATE